MQNSFDRYIEINEQIKALETEKKSLAEAVLPEIKAAPEGKIKLEAGTFSLRTSRKYGEYPEYVQVAESAYKDAKIKAETNGEVECVVSQTVSFSPKKTEVAF